VAKVTIGFGAWLIVVGVYGYLATDRVSLTALIPAIFGVVLAGLGVLALQDRFRKHAMHAAAFLALLGLITTTVFPSNFPLQLFAWLAFGSEVKKGAAISGTVMAATCFTFIILCLRSFVAARRRQAAAAEEARKET